MVTEKRKEKRERLRKKKGKNKKRAKTTNCDPLLGSAYQYADDQTSMQTPHNAQRVGRNYVFWRRQGRNHGEQ
jgi:hypothetical protein